MDMQRVVYTFINNIIYFVYCDLTGCLHGKWSQMDRWYCLLSVYLFFSISGLTKLLHPDYYFGTDRRRCSTSLL